MVSGNNIISIDFNKILELNSHTCKRAFYRFLITGTGRYAYADEWNMLADCIENIFNTIDERYRWWGDLAMTNPRNIFVQKMFQQIKRLYMETFECRRMFAGYKRLAWGDIVKPEHTNTLIDVAKCLDDAVERSPKRGKAYLLNTDDWGVATSLIEDGTIVFANFGTKTMSPVEVQYFLEKYNIVFVIVIDKGNLGDTGAFYKIFYTLPHVSSNVYVERSFRLHDGAFFNFFGVYGCHEPRGPPYFWDSPGLPLGYLPAYNDYMISVTYKIPTAVPWTYTDTSHNWAYARIGRGTVIEIPLSSLLYNRAMFDWYIGAMAHVLLGEPDNCYIGAMPNKLRKIVWMAKYGTLIMVEDHLIPSRADYILSNWASSNRWRVIDLRTKKS
jgi:hypothetical protein